MTGVPIDADVRLDVAGVHVSEIHESLAGSQEVFLQ